MSANAQSAAQVTRTSREERIRRALFHGEGLVLENPKYLRSVQAFLEELLASDAGDGDLTVQALGLGTGNARGAILAREKGIAAGISECSWLLMRGGLTVRQRKGDGEPVDAGEILMEAEGPRGELLASERVALNLLQRMSGIATMTRRLQERVQRRNPATFLIATRKTPWGLLDKRAVHLGGGGTHRLSLSDAILVKNNHLAALGGREEEAVVLAIERAWTRRDDAAFIEIEVRSVEAALAAARTFRGEQEKTASSCPRLLLLDNMPPPQVRRTLDALQAEQLRDDVLIEVSGAIAESNLEEYAACGADALSMGALTHSPRALDISLRIL
jgi:nicotinate-nucleotide pyrophosphorylase (carboxylating)